MFTLGDLVWVRTDQYPLWPGIIAKNKHKESDGKYYYIVKFMGEKSKALIKVEDVFQFDVDRAEFSPGEKVLKKYKALQKALEEASKKHISMKLKLIKHQEESEKGQIRRQNENSFIDEQNKQTERASKKGVRKISKQFSVLIEPDFKLDRQQQSIRQEIASNLLQDVEQANVSYSQSANASKKSVEKWEPPITCQFLDEISRQILNRSKNPVQAEVNRLPAKSFKHLLPSRHTISKPNNIDDKRKQRQQRKAQSLSKILIDYMAPSPTSIKPEQKAATQIKFKLQCIVFLLLDSSSNIQPQRIKLAQLISIFNIDSIDYTVANDMKISSLLSFIESKLPDDLKKQKEWVTKIISQINSKVVRQLNNYEFYQKVQSQTANLFSSKSNMLIKDEISSNNDQKQYSEIANSYRSQVIELLNSRIKQLSQADLQLNTNQILQFLDDQTANIEKAWECIMTKLKNSYYEKGEDCHHDLCEFMSNPVV